MKFEDVMYLVKAGFTSDQIAKLAGDQNQDPEKDPEKDTKKDPKQEPSIADVMQEMKEIRGEMQKMALLGTNQKLDQTDNVDQILAAIINPQQKKEDK